MGQPPSAFMSDGAANRHETSRLGTKRTVNQNDVTFPPPNPTHTVETTNHLVGRRQLVKQRATATTQPTVIIGTAVFALGAKVRLATTIIAGTMQPQQVVTAAAGVNREIQCTRRDGVIA